MKADSYKILGDLISPNKTMFRIPVYQRNYEWNEEHCDKLLNDIEYIMNEDNYYHFLGTMVILVSKVNQNEKSMLHDYTVIDGQQRITTIIILLKALCDSANSLVNEINEILYNRYSESMLKLKSSSSEYKQLEILLNGQANKLSKTDRVFINYHVCLKRIQKWIESGKSPNEILDALNKIEVVAIKLEDSDRPQFIFESINSTGLVLSNADLIRNFLLINESLSQQERLFKYWRAIEDNLKDGNNYEYINNFFNNYMTFKTNSPLVNEQYLYRNFIVFVKKNNYSNEDILMELKRFSEIYKFFIKGDNEKKYPTDIINYIRALRTLNQTTCYPFLLHIFDDYDNKIIDAQTLSKTVKLIFSYILRRIVCKIASHSLRGFFAYLYARVFQVFKKDNYYEAINKFLFELKSNDAMPNDKQFIDALMNEKIYKLSSGSICKFLLTAIENWESKEILQCDNLTIEHIMPQTLPLEWQRVIPSSVHEKYLHTLGNLTITGYNSELSDKSFLEKVKLIREKSKATILNMDVINKKQWTEQTIRVRALRLVNIIMKIFDIKQVNVSLPPTSPQITLNDDFNIVTGKKLISFTFDNKEYKPKTFAAMLIDVIKILDELKPGILEKLASENFSFRTGKKVYMKRNSYEGINKPKEIKENIFIETNISSKDIMRFLASLFEQFGIDKKRFYILIKTRANNQ